jgi:hypothetical protein
LGVPETAVMGSNWLPGEPGGPLVTLEACAKGGETDESGSPFFVESTDSLALFEFVEGSASEVEGKIGFPETAKLVGSNPGEVAGWYCFSTRVENKGGDGSDGSEEGGGTHCPSVRRGACSSEGGFGRGGRERSKEGALAPIGGLTGLDGRAKGEPPREEDQFDRKLSTVDPARPRKVEGRDRC